MYTKKKSFRSYAIKLQQQETISSVFTGLLKAPAFIETLNSLAFIMIQVKFDSYFFDLKSKTNTIYKNEV